MKRPSTPPTEPAEPTEPAVDAPANPEPDTSADPGDWRQRALDSQAAFTRKAQEAADLRRRLEAYEADDGSDEDEADDGEPAPRPPVSSRFRSAETSRPRVPGSERAPTAPVYGPEVTEAYSRAASLLDRAETEADRQTAFEAYHELRSRATSAAPRRTASAPSLATRDQAVEPRVETNRPDGPMDVDQTDPARYAGGANGGVGGWLRERFAAQRSPR
jgi:hypothetical protein